MATRGNTKKKLAKKPAKAKNELGYLPAQGEADVCFVDTSAEMLQRLGRAEEYMQGLAEFRKKFNWEIQEWSKKFDVTTDVRVYFTPKPGGI